MVGTDVDTDSVQSALANVRTNRLESSIQIKGVPQGHILGSDILQEDNKTFTFSMCNPPFYTSDILDEPPGKAGACKVPCPPPSMVWFGINTKKSF